MASDFLANDPGVNSNKLLLVLDILVGPSVPVVSVGPASCEQYAILITMGDANSLSAADFNASAGGIFATMSAGPVVPGDDGGQFIGGSAGFGDGQFYFASEAEPAPPIEVNIVFVGVIRYLIKERAAQ